MQLNVCDHHRLWTQLTPSNWNEWPGERFTSSPPLLHLLRNFYWSLLRNKIVDKIRKFMKFNLIRLINVTGQVYLHSPRRLTTSFVPDQDYYLIAINFYTRLDCDWLWVTLGGFVCVWAGVGGWKSNDGGTHRKVIAAAVWCNYYLPLYQVMSTAK